MYSFAQRTDTTVFDEPFYALYLSKSDAIHPGKAEVLKAQASDEALVKKLIISDHHKPVLFIKNMAHHMEVMKKPFIDNAINIFLIRDPKQIISSYAQVIEKPIMRDIGIEYQYKLFEQLTRNNDDPVVLDSGWLLKNPRAVIEKLCHRCAIGFQPSMLTWEAGPKPYDGVWSAHWYKNVHQSTGFKMQLTSNRALPPHLRELHQQARGYYEKLLPFSIKA
jgi:hypothetical protein